MTKDRSAEVLAALDAAGKRKAANHLRRVRVSVDQKKYLVVHRTSMSSAVPAVADDRHDAVSMALGFASDRSLGTGFLVPYHRLVLPHGDTEIAIPDNAVGSHSSGGFNSDSIAVAIVASGTAHASQLGRLVDECVALLTQYPHLQLIGHHHAVRDGLHLVGSSRDAKKLCPEPVVLMSWLAAEVGKRLVCA